MRSKVAVPTGDVLVEHFVMQQPRNHWLVLALELDTYNHFFQILGFSNFPIPYLKSWASMKTYKHRLQPGIDEKDLVHHLHEYHLPSLYHAEGIITNQKAGLCVLLDVQRYFETCDRYYIDTSPYSSECLAYLQNCNGLLTGPNHLPLLIDSDTLSIATVKGQNQFQRPVPTIGTVKQLLQSPQKKEVYKEHADIACYNAKRLYQTDQILITAGTLCVLVVPSVYREREFHLNYPTVQLTVLDNVHKLPSKLRDKIEHVVVVFPSVHELTKWQTAKHVKFQNLSRVKSCFIAVAKALNNKLQEARFYERCSFHTFVF
jgi:hypothetical protein